MTAGVLQLLYPLTPSSDTCWAGRPKQLPAAPTLSVNGAAVPTWLPEKSEDVVLYLLPDRSNSFGEPLCIPVGVEGIPMSFRQPGR